MPKDSNDKSTMKAFKTRVATLTPTVELSYVTRSITVPNDMDSVINETIKKERLQGNRESRSSIIEKALRAYFT